MKLAKEDNLSEKTLKEQKKKKRHTIICMLEGLVILIVVAGMLIWNSGVIQNYAPAVIIDGKGYRLAEFNFYFNEYYNKYLNDYREFLPYMFDQSKSLKEQNYSEEQTWYDYFKEETIKSMTGTITVARLAEEEGCKLTAEDQETMDNIMDDIAKYAGEQKVDVNQYLKSIYGTGMNEELYKKHLAYSYLAAEYSAGVKAGYQYTEAEIQKHYQENIQEYTYADYERFYVKACDNKEEPTEEEKTAAGKIAGEILEKVEKGQKLEDLGKEYDEFGTYKAFDSAYYDSSFSYGQWLFQEERKDGDAAIIDDGKGYYVMVFHERGRQDYNAADMADLFVEAPVDQLDTSADDYNEQMNELYESSCQTAEQFLEEWKAEGGSEAGFEQLAEKYKESGAISSSYKNLIKGTLDDKLDDWCFQQERKPGDGEVLYTESGFHVVYYIGAGKPAWMIEVESDLRDAQYEAWYQGLIAPIKVTSHDMVLKNASLPGQ